MSAFTEKEKSYGRCKVEGSQVQIYESMYQRRSIPNVPCGEIKDAYWQNNSVHVKMSDGRHYIFDECDNYSTYFYD